MKFKTTFIFLLLSLSIAAQSPAKTIPEFNFYKADKTSFTQQHLSNSKLLFFMFFDAGCDHCQRTMAYFNRHYKKFNKTAVYFITMDSWDKANQFIKDFGKNFIGKKNVSIFQDSNNEFIRKFGPRKYPSVFLYSCKRQLMLYEDDEKYMNKFLNEIQKNCK